MILIFSAGGKGRELSAEGLRAEEEGEVTNWKGMIGSLKFDGE